MESKWNILVIWEPYWRQIEPCLSWTVGKHGLSPHLGKVPSLPSRPATSHVRIYTAYRLCILTGDLLYYCWPVFVCMHIHLAYITYTYYTCLYTRTRCMVCLHEFYGAHAHHVPAYDRESECIGVRILHTSIVGPIHVYGFHPIV